MEAVFPRRAGLMRVQRLKQNQPELFRHGTAFVRGNICNHAKIYGRALPKRENTGFFFY